MVSGGPPPGGPGRTRAGLPGRSRAVGFHARAIHRGLRAEHLGGDDQAAPQQGIHRRGADRRRACEPVDAWGRLRPLPRPDHHPDPRRVRAGDRPRWPDPARRRGPEVPELAGHAALRQEPDALRDRPCQGRHPPREACRHRRGIHRCHGGPPGRIRERRRQPRHRADAGPGRAGQPIRRCGRPRL